MTDEFQFIATEDLTSEHLEHLMRKARRERSIMAHKIFDMVFSAFTATLKASFVSLAQLVRRVAGRSVKTFGPTAPGAKGVSHV